MINKNVSRKSGVGKRYCVSGMVREQVSKNEDNGQANEYAIVSA